MITATRYALLLYSLASPQHRDSNIPEGEVNLDAPVSNCFTFKNNPLTYPPLPLPPPSEYAFGNGKFINVNILITNISLFILAHGSSTASTNVWKLLWLNVLCKHSIKLQYPHTPARHQCIKGLNSKHPAYQIL